MIKTFILVLLALLFLSSHSQSNDAVFAFSWFAGHCKNKKGGCSPQIVNLWDHQSFSIHGLWPAAKAKKKYGDFNISIITSDAILYDNMRNYWPPQSNFNDDPLFLWKHEWDNHGHDYAELIYRLQPKRFQGLAGDQLNNALQLTFYQDVIGFYLNFTGVQKYPYKDVGKKQFAGLLKIEENHFTWSCQSGIIIREAKVCFEVLNSGFRTKPCADLSTVGCKMGVDMWELIEWKKSTQKRVFNSLPDQKAQMEEKGKSKEEEEKVETQAVYEQV